MRSFVICALIFLSFPSTETGAVIRLVEILPPREIKIQSDHEQLATGQILFITSQANAAEVLGYAEVVSIKSESEAVAQVISHDKNSLITVGDTLELFDPHGSGRQLPGRADLLRPSKKGIPARYKPLFFLSENPIETAETLGKGENGIGLASYYYRGLTDRLTISTLAIADALGFPMLSLKYKVYEHDEVTISEGILSVYYPAQGTGAGSLNSYLDVRSNSKLISHTQLMIFSSNIDAPERRDSSSIAQPISSSMIRTGYEYIFDNWDRLLAGPNYDIDHKTLGGYLIYFWMWDHLQVSVGILCNDFSNASISSTGYQPAVDMFWRF